MTKAASRMYKDKVTLFERLVATQPGVERKGATMPYTSFNGNMSAVLNKDGTLALRLPEKERAAFIKKYKSQVTEMYGAVMKEYVDVPDALLARTTELAKHFAVSVAYVRGLKPKATTRKKKTAR